MESVISGEYKDFYERNYEWWRRLIF
jgi:hypothetical protein